MEITVKEHVIQSFTHSTVINYLHFEASAAISVKAKGLKECLEKIKDFLMNKYLGAKIS